MRMRKFKLIHTQTLPTYLPYFSIIFQDTYGVIQCFDNKNCLAFLFSQFNGNIEHLKINDLVEFEFSYEYDRPMACRVSKIAPPV